MIYDLSCDVWKDFKKKMSQCFLSVCRKTTNTLPAKNKARTLRQVLAS